MANPTPEETLNFLNESTNKNKKGKPGMPPKKAIMTMALILTVLAVLGALFSVIFLGKSDSKDNLIKIAARQTDIIRWCDMAPKNARTSDILNTSASLSAIMQTDLATTKSELSKQKVKKIDTLTKKYLDKDTDEKLNSAAQANRFDTEFREVMIIKIDDYRSLLKEASNSTKDKKIRKMLDDFLKRVENYQF